MNPRSLHLLINANFAPAKGAQRLSRITRLCGVLLGVCAIAALILYGITVHFEFGINRISKEALALNEQNKELQVQLNRIQSYKNVQVSATEVPHLNIPDQVVDITAINTGPLPDLPRREAPQPRIYGY